MIILFMKSSTLCRTVILLIVVYKEGYFLKNIIYNHQINSLDSSNIDTVVDNPCFLRIDRYSTTEYGGFK